MKKIKKIIFSSKYKKYSDSSTGLLFVKTYSIWHTKIKNALKPLNITHPQFTVLNVISILQESEKNITQVMISKVSDIDVMTLSQILKLLEKNGFIERKIHLADTRAKRIILKEKGEEVVKKATPLINKINKDFFGILEKNEIVLKDILNRLIEKHDIQ